MNNEYIDVVWKALDNHCRDNVTDDEWDDLCYSMAIIYARHHWMEQNLGKDWKTETVQAEIAERQSRSGLKCENRLR